MRWIRTIKRMPKSGHDVWIWMPGWETPEMLQTYDRGDGTVGFIEPECAGISAVIEGATHWQPVIPPKPPSEFSPIQKAKRSEN